MKRTMLPRRLLSMLLALASVLCLIPANVLAVEVESGESAASYFSSLAFSADEFGTSSYSIEPDFQQEILSYTITVPDYASNFYCNATVANDGDAILVAYPNNWGSISTTGLTAGIWNRCNVLQTGVAGKQFEFHVGQEPSVDNADDTIYTITATRRVTLKGLTVNDTLRPDFDSNTLNYTAGVPEDAETVSITTTAYNSNYSLTINGAQAANDTAAEVTPNWDENGKMTVPIVVSCDGAISTTYTLTLIKEIKGDTPVLSVQPENAEYLDNEVAPKALTVKGTANGTLSYQWYSNSANGTEGATAIQDATAPSFTPAVTNVGTEIKTTYYYCVIKNTKENNAIFTATSDIAKVTVKPDPTPIASVTAADGSDIPADGYTYYVGATEVVALKANAETRASGGTWTYTWYCGKWNKASGTNDQQIYTPQPLKDGESLINCEATYTVDGAAYSTKSDSVTVKVIATSAKTPTITLQPISAEYLMGTAEITALETKASSDDGGKLTYQWYKSTDHSNYVPIESATTSKLNPDTSTEAKTEYYRCNVTNTLSSISGKTYQASLDSEIAVIKFADVAALGGTWQGEGTKASPYLITGYDDLALLQTLVNTKGLAFCNYYFKLTNDIVLPADWTPIGTLKPGSFGNGSGKNIWPFSGNLDGDGYTLTVAEDGLPLFGYVRWASVKNLNIFGIRIAGYGLVNNYCVDYGPTGSYGSCSHAVIDIENVTLKSGSSTLKAGFIGGFASGINTVNIRGCIAERDVTIGYMKDQYQIGTFAGTLAGTIENCVSYANVYGVSYVGGLAGIKNQSMGPCAVRDSAFCGTVTATGEYAGGIMGGGYGSPSAPNTPCVTIQNCYVTGMVNGTDRAGGIFGGEPACKQCWANGIGYIQNNCFSGTITATGENVGGVIGYMTSLDRYNVIENNYYLDTCSAEKGIGGINTENIDLTSEKYGRSDNPTGADAEKLTVAVTAAALSDGTVTAALNDGKNSSGNWTQGDNGPIFGEKVYLVEFSVINSKDRYEGGDSLDLSTLKITARYSDGTIKEISPDEVVISGFSSLKAGYKTLLVAYSGHYGLLEIRVTSDAEISDETITVRFTLLGDSAHGENGDTHTLHDHNLVTWISAQSFTVSKDAMVLDVFERALDAVGATFGNRGGNYIYSITYKGVTLEEFTNGPKSGWMYTLNGRHPLLGVNEQDLKNGDVIIFHYTDDYTKEEGSEEWNPPVPIEPSPVLTPAAEIKNGTAAASVTADELNAAVKAAEKQGEHVVVIAPKVNGRTDSVSVSLPATSLKNAIAAAETSLRLDTEIGSVELSSGALNAAVEKASDSAVEITVARRTAAELKDKINDAEGAVIAEVTLTSGGKAITSFDGAPLMITLCVGDGYEEGGIYKVVVISADGTIETLSGKCVKKDGKTYIEVQIAHLSTFVVTSKKIVAFTDVVSGAWYYDDVVSAVNGGLMTGTGEDTFSPGAKMTRAMLVTTLYRLAGSPAVVGTVTFADVQSGMWYSNAVLWAVQNKITEGYDRSKFGTNDSVTREQFMTMLLRYAEYRKCDIEKSVALDAFKDAGSISDWALQAMSWAVAEELIDGRAPDTLVPRGGATRAEAAAILTRFAARFQ